MKENRKNTQNNLNIDKIDDELDDLASFVYGKNSVLEYLTKQNSENDTQTSNELALNWRIQKIFVSSEIINDAKISKIKHLAQKLKILLVECSKFKLDRMLSSSKNYSNENHQGIVALITTINTLDFHDFFDDLLKKYDVSDLAKNKACVIMLDSVEDPRNLGAIIRTCEATSTICAIIPRHRSASINAISIKASAGAMAYFPLIEVTNLKSSLDYLKKIGFWVTGLSGKGSESIYEAKLAFPMVLVLGSEGKGISRLISQECDFMLNIPISGQCESLNVSVAASVFLYEIWRQKTQP